MIMMCKKAPARSSVKEKEEYSLGAELLHVEPSQPTPFFQISFKEVLAERPDSSSFLHLLYLVFGFSSRRFEINTTSEEPGFYDSIGRLDVSRVWLVIRKFPISLSVNGVNETEIFFFLCRFQQVNEERVQQMERENSFITRWNDKKDTTVSRPRRTQMEITGGVFVCACIDLPACVRASQVRDSFEQLFWWIKIKKRRRCEEVEVREKGLLLLLTFTAGTLCLDASDPRKTFVFG